MFKKSFALVLGLFALITFSPSIWAMNFVTVTPKVKLPAMVFPGDPAYYFSYHFATAPSLPNKYWSVPVYFVPVGKVGTATLNIPGLTILAATPTECANGLPGHYGLTLGSLSEITGGCTVEYRYTPPADAEGQIISGGPYSVYDFQNPAASVLGHPNSTDEINFQVTKRVPPIPTGKLAFNPDTQLPDGIDNIQLKEYQTGNIEIRNIGTGTIRGLSLDLTNQTISPIFDHGLNCLTTPADPATSTTILGPGVSCYVHYDTQWGHAEGATYLEATALNAGNSVHPLHIVVSNEDKGEFTYKVDNNPTDEENTDLLTGTSGTIHVHNTGTVKIQSVHIQVPSPLPSGVVIDPTACNSLAGSDLAAGSHCDITYNLADASPTFSPIQIVATGLDVENNSHTLNINIAQNPTNVRTWGENYRGQLGIGNTTNQYYPTAVVGALPALQTAAGTYHSCAVLETGALKCWGYNTSGQLGDNSTTDSLIPIDVYGLNANVVKVTAGSFHTCAILTDGSLKCWGYNYKGQLGIGTSGYGTNKSTPQLVGTGYQQVAAGNQHTCAIQTDGSLKCWGDNYKGQLGIGTSGVGTDKSTPQLVGTGYQQIATGNSHTCAILTDGSLKCWGNNIYGQLGIGTSGFGTDKNTPQLVGTGYQQVAAGTTHTCAIQTDGSLKCWGYNYKGQLGIGTSGYGTNKSTPQLVGTGYQQVAAGISHTCAILANRNLQCWGSNDQGQLGIGIGVPYQVVSSPALVGTNYAQVHAGSYYTIAVTTSN